MKKTLILLLFIFILAGCQSKSDVILSVTNDEIIVCEDTCVTTQTFGTSYNSIYGEIIDGYIVGIAEHTHDYPVQVSGDTAAKEEINRTDPITDRYDIPVIEPYKIFDSALQMMGRYIYRCTIDGICDETFNVFYSELIELDYGFDDQSGFLKFHGKNIFNEKMIEEVRFNVSEENFGFEWLYYLPETGVYIRRSLHENIYREYRYNINETFQFIYINSTTFEHVFYSSYDYEIFKMYDPESELLYEVGETSYKMSQYDNFEFVASLKYQNETVINELGMFFMNGWDSITYRSSNEIPYDRVYSNEERVFENYTIFSFQQNMNYREVLAQIHLSEDDVVDYQFPIVFTGNITFETLKDELDQFVGMKNPLDIANLTKDKIKDKCKSLLEEYIDLYGVS